MRLTLLSYLRPTTHAYAPLLTRTPLLCRGPSLLDQRLRGTPMTWQRRSEPSVVPKAFGGILCTDKFSKTVRHLQEIVKNSPLWLLQIGDFESWWQYVPYLRHHRLSSWPKGEYDSTRSGRRITLGTRYQIPTIFQRQDRSTVPESISAASRRHANSCGCALRRVRACVTFGCEKKSTGICHKIVWTRPTADINCQTTHRRSFSSTGPDHQRLASHNRISRTHETRCRCTNFEEGRVWRDALTNYRPISNIMFVAKTTERFVAQQVQHFMEENSIYGIYQSAYRAHHSAETALMRIHNDIAHSIDNRQSVLLVLLDLSAAFNTINHTILLRRLSGYGLSGDVLAWLTSYLCDRTYVVRVKSGVSESDIITTGVPQGTVLGPLLFNVFIAPLTTLLQKHNIRHHLYADDTQLYITFPPTDHTQALARMEACVQDAKAWLCDNGLVMNNNKSQAIVIHSSSLRTPTSLTRVNICGQLVETSPVIWDLGFNVDANLTMTSQVANVCRSAYYHLSQIAKIWDSISTTVCKSLIHGLVTSRLDYGNAILYGISDRHMHRLEMVQRSAARIVRQIRRGDRQSMITILRQLHWLPVRKRIDFKLLVHRAIYNGTPEYLAALLRRHTPPRSLRSAGGLLLEVPKVNLERFGRRAFACAGPTLWNKLPRNIRDNSNITQFKKQLKTLLFST